MSSQFITNRERLLSDVIKRILPNASSLDILVGYFYFSGYKQLADKLEDKHVKILVGLDIEVSLAHKINEVEKARSSEPSRGQMRDEYYGDLVSAVNTTDMLDSAASQERFRLFYKKLLDGSLEIRKTVEPCHAKMYLFAYKEELSEEGDKPGVVITGSSNLSYEGLSGRLELNVRFDDKGNYDEGKRIFDEMWAEAVVIADQDSHEEWDKQVVQKIWIDKTPPPYVLYLRVLKEYFDLPGREGVLTPHDLTEGRYADLRYQTDAVKMALNSLEIHNGAIVADVVGLGKSIVAATVAKNLSLYTIIVCPPHLMEQWREYVAEFHISANIFSAGKTEAAYKHLENLQRSDKPKLVIIDEAHRFRNEYTKDYENLHKLCVTNKVLLLTATPFNNRPDDIYALLKLFQVPTRSTLNTVENLGEEFHELIKKYRDLRSRKRDKKLSDEELKREVDEISGRIRSIIGPLVIRRSRLDLEAIGNYKDDLALQNIQLTIPEAPEEMTYDLSSLRKLYMETLERISPDGLDEGEVDEFGEFVRGGSGQKDGFKSARYRAVLYARKDKREELGKKLEESGVELNMLTGRQVNLAKFMRRLLVSRFESSVAAFKASLSNMIGSYESLLKWIGKRKTVPIFKKGDLPDVDSFYETTDDGFEELDEVFERYRERGFFEIKLDYLEASFIEDLKADLALLKDLRETWFGPDNEIAKDPKLEAFKSELRLMLKREPLRKIVVFSTYADTVNYLGGELARAGIPVMKYTSADASGRNKEAIRANFDAGIEERLMRDDFKVLVATDAISEGYNLHRAGTIFNYDIPYNPTRVIQRIGRINRVNKKVFDKLYVYNYFPTDIGERDTATKEISTLKMAMIHAIMGEDTRALTKDEELQAYFKERYETEVAKNEAKSWDTPYRELLSSVRNTKEYEEAMQLPLRARTGRSVKKACSGVLVFGKKGKDFVFKLASSGSEIPKALTAEAAFALFSAEPSEEPRKLSASFDALYQQAKASLFAGKGPRPCNSERLLREATAKVKGFWKIAKQGRLAGVSLDYLTDLLSCLEADALPGKTLRFLTKLKQGDLDALPRELEWGYLKKLLSEGQAKEYTDETLILAEEFSA